MKLSIIVPVYNMASDGKLEYCLNSLINQTLDKREYEIIAVDDASTDNSADVLNDFAHKYPDLVRVIRHTVNKRQGGAKNTGIRAALGEWIGFIDSDDWVSNDFYEKMLIRAKETGADVVGCDYTLVYEHTMNPGVPVENNTFEQAGVLDETKHKSLILRPGSMVIKIFKKSVIDLYHLGFPEGIFYEDNCASPLWSMYFKHFEYIDEPMYFYYQHNISTVHHITTEKCLDRMKAQALFYSESKSRGFLEKYPEEIEYGFTELFYVNTLFSYMSGVKHPKIKFIKNLLTETLFRFPEFEKNKYYIEYTGDEEKSLIQLQRKSNLAFYVYYRLKSTWRNVIKSLREMKQLER